MEDNPWTEARVAELDHWLGRSRLGIEPADRLFLLWGHAHLFGSGLNGASPQATPGGRLHTRLPPGRVT